jgi:hypothetical protein
LALSICGLYGTITPDSGHLKPPLLPLKVI